MCGLCMQTWTLAAWTCLSVPPGYLDSFLLVHHNALERIAPVSSPCLCDVCGPSSIATHKISPAPQQHSAQLGPSQALSPALPGTASGSYLGCSHLRLLHHPRKEAWEISNNQRHRSTLLQGPLPYSWMPLLVFLKFPSLAWLLRNS